MSRVCVFLADGFEEVEGLTVVDLLRRAGEEVMTVSVMGRKEITGSHGITVLADSLFKEVDYSGVDLVVLPGGMPGTKYLKESEELTELLTEWNGDKKKLAAICAAPSVFGELGFLQGKTAVCYPGFESSLQGAVVGNKCVEVDGHITTSKGPGTAMEFALTLIAQLQGVEKAEEIRAGLLYER